MKKSLFELLKEKGLKDNELSNHCSDLYCRVSKESTEAINEYQSILGIDLHVTKFIDQIDKELWYDIPGGYSEYFNKK